MSARVAATGVTLAAGAGAGMLVAVLVYGQLYAEPLTALTLGALAAAGARRGLAAWLDRGA